MPSILSLSLSSSGLSGGSRPRSAAESGWPTQRVGHDDGLGLNLNLLDTQLLIFFLNHPYTTYCVSSARFGTAHIIFPPRCANTFIRIRELVDSGRRRMSRNTPDRLPAAAESTASHTHIDKWPARVAGPFKLPTSLQAQFASYPETYIRASRSSMRNRKYFPYTDLSSGLNRAERAAIPGVSRPVTPAYPRLQGTPSYGTPARTRRQRGKLQLSRFSWLEHNYSAQR